MALSKADSQMADKNGNPLIGPAQATIASVATTAATNSSPYGFAQTQADAIVSQLNLVIAALKAHGLVK
jgi:hypothetical protein